MRGGGQAGSTLVRWQATLHMHNPWRVARHHPPVQYPPAAAHLTLHAVPLWHSWSMSPLVVQHSASAQKRERGRGGA